MTFHGKDLSLFAFPEFRKEYVRILGIPAVGLNYIMYVLPVSPILPPIHESGGWPGCTTLHWSTPNEAALENIQPK